MTYIQVYDIMRNMTENTPITLQDDNIRNRIRTMILDGKEIKTIQHELDIPSSTWELNYWRDTKGFRMFIAECRKLKFLQNAESISDEIANLDATGDSRILAIKQKEAEFLRETLGKDSGYSKRIETIGLNLNKTEPLDEEQKKKLDKLFKKADVHLTKDIDYVPVDEDKETILQHDIDNVSN